MSALFRIPGPLGNYLVFTKLNKGGMADVYLGQPMGTPERWVAIKVLLSKLSERRKFIQMFDSEGKLGMLFNHPNIVRTWDVGQLEVEGNTLHYLAMDYVHGRDLGAVGRYFRNNQGARMPVNQALYVAREVLSGLAYAHDLEDDTGQPLHLVNRDVSPANVMISFDGHVRLIDFGIAQATMDFRSQIGSIRGKLSYMSPEQVRGLPVDARSDLFSLSVVLYQLLTGVEPFAGEGEFEQMEKIRAVDPTPPSQLNHHVTPGLEAIIMKGLSKAPAERFYDAREMMEAVEAEQAEVGATYGKEEMGRFMATAFKSDIELLQARVSKARAILSEMNGAWGTGAEAERLTSDLFDISVDLDTNGGAVPQTGDPTVVLGRSGAIEPVMIPSGVVPPTVAAPQQPSVEPPVRIDTPPRPSLLQEQPLNPGPVPEPEPLVFKPIPSPQSEPEPESNKKGFLLAVLLVVLMVVVVIVWGKLAT